MNTEADRIDLLIRELTGNNAAEFARRTNIHKTCVSMLRHGKVKADAYYSRILAAFPGVSREWLISGEGKSGLPGRGMSPADYEAKISRLEGMVDTLMEEVRMMQEMARKLIAEKRP